MDINRYKATDKLDKKHLVSLANYTEEEIYEILIAARDISARLAAGEKQYALKGKYVYLITKSEFSRSRIAFETAVTKLSGTYTVSTLPGSKLDTILSDDLSMKAIAYYGVDAIVVRTEFNADAELLEKHVDIPIVNANSKSGPCEALAALLTVWEEKGRLNKLKVVMVGEPDKFADSIIYAFIKCGAEVTLVCPKNLAPNDATLNYCTQYGGVTVTDDLVTAAVGADCIYVSDDGLPKDYEITANVLSVAKPSVSVLHTLPVVSENHTVSSEVLESKNFVGLRQAENLQRIEMAVLTLLVP